MSTERADYPKAYYLVALIVYVALGLTLKTVVLNWIVGPLFLLVAVYALPTALGAIARKVRTR